MLSPRLEQWSPTRNPHSGADVLRWTDEAPLRLVGIMHNHPGRFVHDGDPFTTTMLIDMNWVQRKATDQNIKMLLGEPDPKWVTYMQEHCLYTTLKLLALYAPPAIGTKAHVLAQLERGEGVLANAKDDEPVFILKASDFFAPFTVNQWVGAVNASTLGGRSHPGTMAKLASARERVSEMMLWQNANTCKVPD